MSTDRQNHRSNGQTTQRYIDQPTNRTAKRFDIWVTYLHAIDHLNRYGANQSKYMFSNRIICDVSRTLVIAIFNPIATTQNSFKWTKWKRCKKEEKCYVWTQINLINSIRPNNIRTNRWHQFRANFAPKWIDTSSSAHMCVQMCKCPLNSCCIGILMQYVSNAI